MVQFYFREQLFHSSGSPGRLGSKPLDRTVFVTRYREDKLVGFELMQRMGARVIFKWRPEMPAYGAFEMENDGGCRCIRNYPLLCSLLRECACVELSDLHDKDRWCVLELVLDAGYAFLHDRPVVVRLQRLRCVLKELAEEQNPGVCISSKRISIKELSRVITTSVA
jgi:hypothetical protein